MVLHPSLIVSIYSFLFIAILLFLTLTFDTSVSFLSSQEVGSLVRETRIEDWDVFTCINCNTDTHALHAVKKYDRVLISRGMEVKKKWLRTLKHSCLLRECYGLVINRLSKYKYQKYFNLFSLDVLK